MAVYLRAEVALPQSPISSDRVTRDVVIIPSCGLGAKVMLILYHGLAVLVVKSQCPYQTNASVTANTELRSTERGNRSRLRVRKHLRGTALDFNISSDRQISLDLLIGQSTHVRTSALE
jgi:hypothetical protein